MTISMERINQVQRRARIRKLNDEHLQEWERVNALIPAGLLKYNPVGMTHKPGSYWGRAETTYLVRMPSGNVTAHRDELLSAWVFKYLPDPGVEVQKESLPSGYVWKRHQRAWFGYINK